MLFNLYNTYDPPQLDKQTKDKDMGEMRTRC